MLQSVTMDVHAKCEIEPEEELFDKFINERFFHELQLTNFEPHHVIPYFATSNFYNQNCSNQGWFCRNRSLSMLTILAIAMARVEPERINEEMRRYKGRQYFLEGAWMPKDEPGRYRLFTVVRQNRFSSQDTVNTGLYFIIDAAICQAPTLFSVLQARYVSISVS